ncbi:MAG: CRISPR-associated endonuclease Cas2 [Methylococcaceae bacterium]
MNPDLANNLTRKGRWMIAYDISDHHHRRLIHQTLKDHGQRVQYSVFECELSKKQLQDLRIRLREYMADDDSIRWYPLCHWCESRIDSVGNDQTTGFDRFYLA